jgi:hypothetical protein
MTDVADDPRIAELKAAWMRMDAPAAAEVLRSTTWSYLTGGLEPPGEPAEPMDDWDPSTVETQPTEDRAAFVAWSVLSHDPRFATQLRRLWRDPFSEDFREFVYLLVSQAAEAGALYTKHFDADRSAPADRLARATAALMGVDLLPDGGERGARRP